MKIKVRRDVLTEKIQKFLDLEEVRLAAEVEHHKLAQRQYRENVVMTLEQTLEKILGGQEVGDDDWDNDDEFPVAHGNSSGSSWYLRINVDYPQPKAPIEVDYKIRRDLEAVKGMPEKVVEISIGPEDHLWRYLSDPERVR